ncbi:MAG: response regulator [Planctomycetota bacterium]|nr:response regulator [Planctomycetota bacterium]
MDKDDRGRQPMQPSTHSAVSQLRILVLAKSGIQEEDLCSRFGQNVEFRTVHSFDEALAALRDDRYDFVVADRVKFLSLESAMISQQAVRVLETIGQGVCLVDPQGRLVWANPAMNAHPDDLIDKVCEACAKIVGETGEGDAGQGAQRLSLVAGDDQHFEVSVTPVVDAAAQVTQAAVVVWDITQRQRLQKKIDAIDMAGREIARLDVETTSGMSIEARISLLEQKILRYMHDLLHFDNFAVLLIDKKTNRLEIVLQHGMSERTGDYTIVASAEDNGISGYVAAVGRSYLCPDTSADPRYLTGLESARSSLTVPLRLHDKVIGVFDIESDRPSAFNEEDRQFAEILAGHIAIALNILDLLVTERFESTGQLADDVSAEIAGPLNDITTETSTLMDEYIGNAELRRRLEAIRDHVADIKEIVKEVASPQSGILGRRGTSPVDDPLLAGKRVLVADDEQIIRETVGGVLRRHGCHVETASDGNEAVEMLDAQPFDLVLADIKMPQKNGYEVFSAARDIENGVPVILMTGFGYDPNHSIVRARGEGLSAVLFKPFKVELLISEVHNALQPKAS